MSRTTSRLLAAILVPALCGCGWLGRGEDERREDDRDPLRRREIGLEEYEAEVARPVAGLSLNASLDKETYTPQEPVVLELRLQNVSGVVPRTKARDIPVYFEPFARVPEGGAAEWLFKFLIQSETEGKVVYRSPDFEVPKDRLEDYYHYMTLPPRAFVGWRFRLRRGSLEPGRYSLLAWYEVNEDFRVIINRDLTESQVELLGKEKAYVRVWTGKVFSNRVRFRVRPERRGPFGLW
ncbi:MAG: hypothetical protein ACLF0G_04015 [Candidatus Brocadiia bacterium]